MKIKLSPIRMDAEPLQAFTEGDKITINGAEYDFAPLKKGETLPQFEPFASDIERDEDGVICLTLKLPHGDNAPEETRFHAAYGVAIDVEGEVPVPPYNEHVA
ncbi:hypothetical protein ACSZOB_03400 [Aeromonas veronii]